MSTAYSSDLRDYELSQEVYRRFLSLIRRYRRLRRQLFRGATPEWITDLSNLAGHINLIGILPTVLAVLLVPRHFFRRLKENSARCIPLSVSPIKLVWQSSALVGLCLIPFQIRFDSKLLFAFILAVAISSPIWMFAVMLLTATVAFIFRQNRVRARSWGEMFAVICLYIVARLLPLERTKSCLVRLFSFRMSVRKLLWGSCYFSMSILFWMTAVVGICGCLTLLLLVGDYFTDGKGTFATVGLLISLMAIAAATRPVITAYGCMLEAAALYPSALYYRTRRKKIDKAYGDYFAVVDRMNSRETSRAIIMASMSELIQNATEMESRFRKDEKSKQSYLRSRAAGLSNIGSMRVFFDHPEELAVCECFSALERPTPISDDPSVIAFSVRIGDQVVIVRPALE